MLEVNNLNIFNKKSGKYLVENLSFNAHPGDKIAVIGEEGNGKTTLLKIINGDKDIYQNFEVSGDINKKGKISFLKQFFEKEFVNQSIEHFFLKDNPEEEINYDNYNKYNDYMKSLSDLGMNPKIISSSRKISSLSGGEKVKIRLAKILCEKADILLLDEPTNDIDIETLELLENIINNLNIPIIYVSHDETLLENTCNVIIHLEQINRKTKARSTVSKLNYSDYIEKRMNFINKENQLHFNEKKERKEQEKKISTIKQVVQDNNPERQNAMRQVIATQNRLNKEDVTMYYDTEESINVFFDEEVKVPNGKVIVNLENYCLKLKNGNKIENINFNITGSEHVVIYGQNGSGKTTFIKEIYNMLKEDKSLNIGYMPQTYEEEFKKYQMPIEFLNSKEPESFVRALMGRMKFTTEEQLLSLNNLSGGQKAKLYILKMILNKNNVLLLDEPTRNLSPLSNPVIRNILIEYKGAIISISHDRKFISEVADTIYNLEYNELKKIEYIKRKTK